MSEKVTKSPNSSASSLPVKREQSSFFNPLIQPKLKVNDPGDIHEQEADRVADKVVHDNAPIADTFFSAAPKSVQRDDKKGTPSAPTPPDNTGKVLSEGAGIVLDQLEDKPGFEEWEDQKTAELKLKLWDSQPDDFKAGIIGFGLASAGILGTTLALDPHFRGVAADAFQDINLALPLKLLPYHDYFGIDSFKYKLPSAAAAPYTFETGFELKPFFKLMSDEWNIPKVDLGFGIDSTYSDKGGFQPFTGGSVKLKIGGGMINFTGYFNESLPPTPVMITDPRGGDSPAWMMRSLPSQLEDNLPKGNAVFITIDVMKVVDAIHPSQPVLAPQRDEVSRKEKSGDSSSNLTAPPIVSDVLSSGDGVPLENKTKHFMEDRFGQDFSDVRVHTDGKAAESANSINAKAYTSGNDIVFGGGEYQPSSEGGKSLLAHELVHVVQQTGTVQRKTKAQADKTLTDELREKLDAGLYSSAWLQLNDYLDWGDIKSKKAWLADHRDIRFLFLKHQPATVLAEIYSAEELMFKPVGDAFAMIDCWYQGEEEKQLVYAQNLPLFDRMVQVLSPYTGEKIVDMVQRLIVSIPTQTYSDIKQNQDFTTINLVAPTTLRKMKFYKQYENLFKVVSKKFDPFTGISIATMEFLTDTNEVDRIQALKMYNKLLHLPPEQRQAFLETALFSGGLEADKDAEAYYEKNFNAQYKALPHNWDSAIMPWNWGSWDAPFAERLTVDHIALMSSALNYEDKSSRKFGFDRGIDEQFDKDKGQTMSDATRLIMQMKEDVNFNDPKRLGLLLAIAVRGRQTNAVTEQVLVPKSKAGEIAPAVLQLIENNGFIAKDNFKYQPDSDTYNAHDNNMYWYLAKQSLFGGKSSKIIGEQRVTVDLPTLQDTTYMKGSINGVKFGRTGNAGDKYYNETWLDKAVKDNYGSDTLLGNLEETKGADRQGKIFASIRDDVRQTNIYASSLPMDGLNYFAYGSLYRSGPGILQGLEVHISWAKDAVEDDNEISVRLDIGNVEINDFQLIAPKTTLAIGHIGMKGLRLTLNKSHLHAPAGVFKNAKLTVKALTEFLPNVLKLLPYAVMTMTEEFKGAKAHAYKDKLGVVMDNDFASLQSSLTFTSLEVNNLYDTTAGFLDDFSIEDTAKDENGMPKRQGLAIKENSLWWVDASINIRNRIKAIDLQVRSKKAEVAGSNADKKLETLEKKRKELIDSASAKSLRYEDNSEDMAKLRFVTSTIRTMTAELDAQFDKAKADNPLFSPLGFQVLAAERERLEKDLNYLDNQYTDDKKRIEEGKEGAERFEARKRKAEFEAKYKSFEVDIRLRGVTLKGGNYVRDLINESLKSMGFQSPQLEGIENINIGAIDSAFTASGEGAAAKGKDPGVAIRQLKIPLIKAPSLSFKTGNMLLEAGAPHLENVFASVTVDFAANPLDKDPSSPYKYKLSSLWIGKGTFNGLTLRVGQAPPLLDFPNKAPVEVWGLHLKDYDPEKGNINISIRDVKAIGVYADKNETDKTSQQIGFGIDTTLDNKTEQGKKNAIEVQYDKADESIVTKVNIASAWLPSIDVQSPDMSVTSLAGTDALQVKDLQADVKISMKKEDEEGKEARPMSVEINSLHVGEINAQGIKLQLRETPDTASSDPKKKKPAGKVQEISLPQKDKVYIKDINVSGLRITLAEDGTTLSTIKDDASVKVGDTNLSGIGYTEKNAKGSVLRAIALHSGKFQSLTLGAVGRNGREYNLKEFFKFFGSTRLEGLEASGSYSDGKNSGTIGVKGMKNRAISVEYHEPQKDEKGGKDKPGYYDIRLPLSRITVPGLHIESGDHEIDIPKPKDKSHISYLSDVDVKLKAYVEIGDKVTYDIYLESLDIADFGVYGLEYHNKGLGIDVVFDKNKPLHIPNVKAGGFRFSSSNGFDVFGNAGGWLTAAGGEEAIEASLDKIKARIEDGGFLAEKDGGRSALTVDIASFGFTRDKAGNMTIKLGAIHGGFPKMTITQTDFKEGSTSTTVINSFDDKAINADGVTVNLNADSSKEIDVQNLAAGNLKVTSTDWKGKDTSTTTVNLKPEAIGARSTNVKLNADGTKEILIQDIYAGKIDIDSVSNVKGGSQNIIKLPDPKSVTIGAVKIMIDKEGKKKITIQKPTIHNFQLRKPAAAIAGDYMSVLCDLMVDGDIEMGDGNFEAMKLEPPFNAFILSVPGNVPVKVSNLRLEYKDTSTSPETVTPPKELTDGQKKLLELEKTRDAARETMFHTPAEFYGPNDTSVPNPEWEIAADAYQEAVKAYDAQKAALIAGAKADAKASMPKKYLDAVEGQVKGSLTLYGNNLPLNIETYKGENYVEISDSLVSAMKPVITSIIEETVLAPFWDSPEMIKLAKTLQHWYITAGAPTLSGYLSAFASGNGIGSVLLVLKDANLSKGTVEGEPTMFGLNLDLNSSWLLDIIGKDDVGVLSLCEKTYKHPEKDDFYSLYGIIEQLMYVSPAIVSNSGQTTNENLKKLLAGTQTQDELDNMSIKEVGAELGAYIAYGFGEETKNIRASVKKNIGGVNVTADVSLKPQEVITELLKEKKAGTFTFKDKKSIDNLHIQGDYNKAGNKETSVNAGGGTDGKGNISIPGGDYFSQDKGTHVIYDSLEITPLQVNYQDDVLKLFNDNISLKGLQVGIKK